MNEEFEKQLILQVRGQLLINWLSSVKDMLSIPFEEYSRFHRKMFSILIVELMSDGLKYSILQKNKFENLHSRYLGKYFTVISTNVTILKDSIPDDEFIYLYHLRNCAAHIFPTGYDYVDFEGNIKLNHKTRMQTKNGPKSMRVEEIDILSSSVSKKYHCCDVLFLNRIYDIVKNNLTPMFEQLSELEKGKAIFTEGIRYNK